MTVTVAVALPCRLLRSRSRCRWRSRLGVTVWFPPVGERVKLLPSVPVTVTWVALVADTVRTEELPATTEVGAALMVTVGADGAGVTVTVAVAVALPPAPVAVAV